MSETIRSDSVDASILRELQNDGRLSNKELAARVGIAPSTCIDRIARLRATGVITGFTATVNADRLGRSVAAFLMIQVQPHARPLVDPFVAHVRALPETVSIHHVTGADDFIVHVACAGSADLQRLVLDEFTARREVARVETHLIFASWPVGPLLPAPRSGSASSAGCPSTPPAP
jgi:DNA-binding Lrp family transcriptional regulator